MPLEIKYLKIGTNEVFKDRQATKKAPLLFLTRVMHKLRYK